MTFRINTTLTFIAKYVIENMPTELSIALIFDSSIKFIFLVKSILNYFLKLIIQIITAVLVRGATNITVIIFEILVKWYYLEYQLSISIPKYRRTWPIQTIIAEVVTKNSQIKTHIKSTYNLYIKCKILHQSK
jgi:hypothetical protein